MKSYKIYLEDGRSYVTSANTDFEEFTQYMLKKVKYYYEEDQMTGEEKYTKIFAVVENN